MIVLWEGRNAENSYLLLSVLWVKDGNPSKGNQQSKQTEKLQQVQKKKKKKTHSSKNFRLQSFKTMLVLDYSLI